MLVRGIDHKADIELVDLQHLLIQALACCHVVSIQSDDLSLFDCALEPSAVRNISANESANILDLALLVSAFFCLAPFRIFGNGLLCRERFAEPGHELAPLPFCIFPSFFESASADGDGESSVILHRDRIILHKLELCVCFSHCYSPLHPGEPAS